MPLKAESVSPDWFKQKRTDKNLIVNPVIPWLMIGLPVDSDRYRDLSNHLDGISCFSEHQHDEALLSRLGVYWLAELCHGT